MRSKGEYLGSVEAPDRERAETVSIKQFALRPAATFALSNDGRAQRGRLENGRVAQGGF
jgi:hypothetical protein